MNIFFIFYIKTFFKLKVHILLLIQKELNHLCKFLEVLWAIGPEPALLGRQSTAFR